jgi:hypothetical protein
VSGHFRFDPASGVFDAMPGLEAIPVDQIGRISSPEKK